MTTLREEVEALALPAGRVVGSKGHERARRHLEDRLRSIGLVSGNCALSCGQILPLKDFVSTVLRIVGTPNTLVAFEKPTTLLMRV